MTHSQPHNPPSDGSDLQFDRAVPAGANADSRSDAMTCSSCSAALRAWYFDVDGQHVCTACKGKLTNASGAVRDWRSTLRALLFGLGAAIAGAIIYYGVIAITNVEIGIVALLIGYMVGFSLRKGSGGRGGMRLQIAGAALTYLSVSLAYLPLAMRGVIESAMQTDSSAVVIDSLAVASETPNEAEQNQAEAVPMATADSASATQVNPVLGLGLLIAFALALPLMVVFGTLPSGLISALIIGIGMRQAWVMTRAAELTVAGPFKVGAKASNSGSAATAA